jgi:hypothetical protein
LFYDFGLSPCVLEADLLAIFPRIDATYQPAPVAVLNMMMKSCRESAEVLLDSHIAAHPAVERPRSPPPTVIDLATCNMQCPCCQAARDDSMD